MAETYGTMSYADVARPREKSSDPLRARQSIGEQAKHWVENGSKEGLKLYGRQQEELRDLEHRKGQERQDIHKQTGQEVADIRPLSLSDVRSPAGLSHYIDRSGDEAMKILEEQIGFDSTWKILVLTTAHTSIELGKGLADILKIGEGTAEGSLALDRTDLSTLEKALAITKGVGIDGLRALAIAGPVLSKLGQILKNVKVPENLLGTTGNEGLKMGDYRAFRGQRGALGERRRPEVKAESTKLVTKAEIIDPLALAQILEKTPKEYGELMRFELAKLRDSKQNFEHIFRGVRKNEAPDVIKAVNENANQWLGDMLGNINNLVRYLEEYPNRTRLKSWMESGGKFNQKIGSGIGGIMEAMKIYRKEFGFLPNAENTNMLIDFIRRLKNIPN